MDQRGGLLFVAVFAAFVICLAEASTKLPAAIEVENEARNFVEALLDLGHSFFNILKNAVLTVYQAVKAA